MTEPELTDEINAQESGPANAGPSERADVKVLPGKKRRLLWGVVAFVLGVGAYFYWRGGGGHTESSKDAVHRQPVAVAVATREDIAQTLAVTGEFRPYQQAELHAKVSGFLQAISVDVGDHVREGQSLAQLDVPELRSEMQKALASHRAYEQEVIRAQANYNEARIASRRLQDVAKQNPRLVAGQDIDAVRAKELSAEGALGAIRERTEEAQAEVNKVRTLLEYTTITAPFEGVITRRYADPGALVQAGTASGAQPVVDIAEHRRLRLAFPVPESAVALVSTGAPVEIRVDSLGLVLQATVSRFSGKLDRATRTMATEADVENADGRLRPGLYAGVVLVLRGRKAATVLPAQALGADGRPVVFVVNRDSVVEERGVVLGIETSAKVEIVSGVSPGEMVVVGGRAGIRSGQKVDARPVGAKSAD